MSKDMIMGVPMMAYIPNKLCVSATLLEKLMKSGYGLQPARGKVPVLQQQRVRL